MNLFILIPGQAVCQYNPASVPILTAAKNKECQRKVSCSSANAGKEKLDDIAKTNVNADANGDALEGADKLTESIKNKWSGFITSTETKGAKVGIPPSGVMVTTKTKDDII